MRTMTLLMLLFPLSLQAQRAADPVLARAGNRVVTGREFTGRFEMLPGLYRHIRGKEFEQKLTFLYSLIAEKLLAESALARGLDRDSLYLSAMGEIRNLFARDELYRREITRKAVISPREQREATRRALREIQVEFLYADSDSDLTFLRSRIHSLRDFQTMALDTSLHVSADTATIIWGDADPRIEEEAYRMSPGQVSRVIRAGDGYYLLAVVHTQTSEFYSSLQPEVLRERVDQTLRKRKEQALLMKFLPETLRDKEGFSEPGPFHLMARALDSLFVLHPAERYFGAGLYHDARSALALHLTDTVSVAGTARWTVDDLLARLYASSFSADSGEVPHIPQRLNSQLRVWVQQELLAQEALRRRLDTTAAVRAELGSWSEHFLGEVLKNRIRNSVEAPAEADVWQFLRGRESTLTVPTVRIRDLRVAAPEAMKDAQEALARGETFASVVRQWSNDSAARASGGLSGFFPVTARPPLGEIASQLNVGERFGPFQLQDGIHLIELADRQQPDTSLSARFRNAGAELRTLRQEEKLSAFIAQQAKERGYAIFEEQLKALDVSHVPMMTYRMLGFGGRVFATPMVEPQFQWTQVEPPSQPVYP